MVSVIIPAYNRAHVIKRAIESVLNQTYKDLELIIVDDCSTDNTKEIVESIHDQRVTYLCLQRNSGACAARNRGIDVAKGEYIAFQDSDDEWLPLKLEKQVQLLEAKEADIIFCGFEKIYSDNKKKTIPENEVSGFCSQEKLLYESIASTQTIVGKADAVKSVRFDESMPRMQDYDFIIRASGRYKIYLLNEALVKVYEQPDSITASKKQYKKRLDVTQKLLRKYENLSVQYPQWHIKMLKIIAHCQVMLRENAADTLKEIYDLERKPTNLAKIYLDKLGILYGLLRIRG